MYYQKLESNLQGIRLPIKLFRITRKRRICARISICICSAKERWRSENGQSESATGVDSGWQKGTQHVGHVIAAELGANNIVASGQQRTSRLTINEKKPASDAGRPRIT
jgi:hypothetical protein